MLVKSMLCLNECKAKLVSFKQCFGHEFGIKSIGIFGSVARQENREDSDLDIVVDIDNPTLSTMYTLKTVLTEMFHCEIDLVRFRSSLSPFLKQNIEKEDTFACYEGDFGGNMSAEEYADDLRKP